MTNQNVFGHPLQNRTSTNEELQAQNFNNIQISSSNSLSSIKSSLISSSISSILDLGDQTTTRLTSTVYQILVRDPGFLEFNGTESRARMMKSDQLRNAHPAERRKLSLNPSRKKVGEIKFGFRVWIKYFELRYNQLFRVKKIVKTSFFGPIKNSLKKKYFGCF